MLAFSTKISGGRVSRGFVFQTHILLNGAAQIITSIHGSRQPPKNRVDTCRAAAVVNLKRGMAGAEGTPKYGAAKSFKDAWLSDKGVSQNRF